MATDPGADADILTASEVASLLRVSVPTVRQYVAEDGLPATRLPGGYRFRREDVERWLAERAA
jgi:excisionase family DNA binding protein